MKKIETNKVTDLTVMPKLKPAAVVGISTNLTLNKADLPEEFKGVDLEIVDSGFNPSVRWNEPGDFVAGIYTGSEEAVGPNSAMLYNFETKQGKAFSVWGTKALDRTMARAIEKGDIAPGRVVLITYLTTTESKFADNPTKLFSVHVAKK